MLKCFAVAGSNLLSFCAFLPACPASLLGLPACLPAVRPCAFMFCSDREMATKYDIKYFYDMC